MRGNERLSVALRIFSSSRCAAIKRGTSSAVLVSRELLLAVLFLSDPSKYRNRAASIKTKGRICPAEIRKLWHWLQSGWLELSTHVTFGSWFLSAAWALLFITGLLCISFCLFKLYFNSRFGGLSPWGYLGVDDKSHSWVVVPFKVFLM